MILGFINGKSSQPVPVSSGDSGLVPHPNLEAWTRIDRLVKSWITATISKEALGTVAGLATSAEVWTTLSSTYSQVSESRDFDMLLKLQQKKKESTSLEEYIEDFKLTCDHLNAIRKPVQDRKKVFWLFNGFGPLNLFLHLCFSLLFQPIIA